jgi:hypothetical protein
MSRKNKSPKVRKRTTTEAVHVPGAAGDSSGDGSFYRWPSTKATDKAFVFLKWLFAKRERPTDEDTVD